MLGRFFPLVLLMVGVTSGCNCEQSRPADGGVSSLNPDSGELTVAVSIAGSGAVQGGAIACQADVDADSDLDAGVCEWSTSSGHLTLTAVAASEFEFSNWICNGTEYRSPRVELDVSDDLACTVTFTRLRPSLLVRINDANGRAPGSVTSSPGGISCGADAGTCTATFDFDTEVTLAAQTAGDGGVVAFVGWSDDCVGTGLTTEVTLDAAKACTATFVSREVTVRGLAGPHGAVAPSSTRVLPGDGVTLTATPDASRVASWSGAFSSGSGMTTGCTGAASSVTVTVLEATPGAVYDCTAAFQPQALVTVRVVPAPSAVTTFGVVSSPCTITDGESTCEALVDTGELTLSATETTNEAGQDLSRFVKWACSTGWVSTSRSATTTIGAATTCVVQFYGLWSRYYEGPSSLVGDPNAVSLAPGVDAGLPTSSSSSIVELNVSGEGTSLASLVATDDEVDGPTLTDWGVPGSDTGGWRISSNGDDAPAVVGWTALGQWNRAGLFGAYAMTRDPGGVVSELTRSPLVALSYTVANGEFYDSVFTSGQKNAQRRHALGGFSTRGFDGEGVRWDDTAAWVVITDATGTPSAATRFLVPTPQDVECASVSMASVTDLMWDPDPANAGGVVVVGATFDTPCMDWRTCPGTDAASSFVAKLDPNLEVLALRNLVGVETRFLSSKVLTDLTGAGYVVLGQCQGASVGFARVSYDLSTLSDQVALAVADPESGSALATTLSDALVDADAGRYVLLASASDEINRSDVFIMTLQPSGEPRPDEGWAFGTPDMDEYAGRLVRPREGGFLFTGKGPWGDTSNIAWATRTDDDFNVPFNDSQPGARRATLRYAEPISLALTGAVNPCGTSVDPASLTVETLTTTHQTFSPSVLIQAP